MRAIRVITWLLLLGGALGSARGEVQLGAETGAIYDSNFSNSDRDSDIKADLAWQSNVRAEEAFQLTRDLRLNLAGDLRTELWSRFDAFDNIAPGGDVALRYRFGLGRQAPWVLVEDSLSYAFLDEDERSGRDNKLRVRGGMALSQWLAAEASYTYDDFSAKDDFWDLSGHSGALRLIFDPTSSLQLALGYSYREGDVISYALPPRPDIVRIASALNPVGSFGNPRYTAYRLQGSTNSLSASADYSLNKYLSFQLTYEFSHTSDHSLTYGNHFVAAKVVFSY